MHESLSPKDNDVWSEWLLSRRHGNSEQRARQISASVDIYAAKVLEGAQLSAGMTLVDVGSGEGLIAFQAIERVGATLNVILTDISPALLSHAQATAVARHIDHQCTFLRCSAEDLHEIPNESVDVVITRSVLAYVSNKPGAFREFYRVLKPGGRISIAEPIFRDDALMIMAMKNWIDKNPDAEDIATTRLIYKWKASQLPNTLPEIMADPMTNYSERDLFAMIKEAQFNDVHLELHLDSIDEAPIPWDSHLESSPHPLSPTLGEILADAFTPAERIQFEQTIRPKLENETQNATRRMAYMSALKPKK